MLIAFLTLTVCVWSLTGNAVAAEESGRPWGKLNQSTIPDTSSENQNGYLGRYNPWGKRADNADAPPRYRKRERSREGRHWEENSANTDYPPGAPGGYNGSPQFYSPYSPMYQNPWGGMGYGPGYGGDWMNPYQNMDPDRGLLWSDMWRW